MADAAGLGPVEAVPTGSITAYPANARLISPKAVEVTARSIEAFGWQQPIVVDKARVIIAGHVRHRAAQQLGLPTVPVIVAAQLTPDQVKAYRIADNRSRDYTAWDYGLLAAELDGMPDDLAKVLDLADWQGILADFESRHPSALPVSTEAAELMTGQHTVHVIFASREAADKAGPAILDLPGVLDVRYAI